VTYSALRFLHECGELVREKHAYRLAAADQDGWHLRSATPLAAVKDALAQATDVPAPAEHEPPPDGWSTHHGSLGDVLRSVPPLRMRPDVKWAAYLFREGGNGNGVVWTLPRDAAVPDPVDCPAVDEDNIDGFLSRPCPPQAIGPGECAVEGDGSAWSWLCLSMLSRAFGEFGARWHGCDWTHHAILADAPADPEHTWEVPPPADFSPRVQFGADGVRVRFWTFTDLVQEQVVQHDDFYATGSVVPVRSRTSIATGLGGMIP
jgi:hypothetical protein